MPVNTTETNPATPPESLEQGIGRAREAFRAAPRKTIRVAALDGADRLGNVVEGGVNGLMFTLQRGVDVPNVPEPILEVLRNAGIGFTVLS